MAQPKDTTQTPRVRSPTVGCQWAAQAGVALCGKPVAEGLKGSLTLRLCPAHQAEYERRTRPEPQQSLFG